MLRIGLLLLGTTSIVYGADAGRWASDPPALRNWFENLKQPDNGISCCGSGDAYGVSYSVEHGQLIAVIIDQRGNHLPLGERIVVPPNKVNHDPNPTGEDLIFLGGMQGAEIVYCFVPGAGI